MIGNYIKAVAAAVSRSTAKLMKTGQTTSYRTGDDGDFEAGRNTSFTVLAENNPFGNTNRFTDELGGQTYTKNIVIDWSTYDGSSVLGWRRTTNGVDINWDNSIDGALAVSIAPFTSGWRLPNIGEMFSICNYGLSTALLDYSPFSLNGAFNFWTSSTHALNTTRAHLIQNTQLRITDLAKTASVPHRYIPCRTFTVTGTTLS